MGKRVNYKELMGLLAKEAPEILRKYRELVIANLANLIKSERGVSAYAEAVWSVFEGWQAEYFSGSAAQDDPTAFKHWKPEIEAEVARSVENSQNQISMGEKGRITVHVDYISDEFLGIGSYGGSKDAGPIHWAYFFVEGHLLSSSSDALLWVNRDTYQKLKGREDAGGFLGRFGNGFMLHAGEPNVQKWFEAAKLDMSQYIHPQSGKVGHPNAFRDAVVQKRVLPKLSEEAKKMAWAELQTYLKSRSS